MIPISFPLCCIGSVRYLYIVNEHGLVELQSAKLQSVFERSSPDTARIFLARCDDFRSITIRNIYFDHFILDLMSVIVFGQILPYRREIISGGICSYRNIAYRISIHVCNITNFISIRCCLSF